MELDPELQFFADFLLPDLSDVAAFRAWADALSVHFPLPPADPRLTIVEDTIPGTGGPAIAIRIYRPAGAERVPVLLYFHGGAFVIGDLDMEQHNCMRYARESGAAVISVQYRLAPEFPFPAGVEDCYAALAWTAKNAARLHLDESRIAVGGGSAGGNLAAAVAIMARDRGGPRAVLQMLIYPVLDDRLTTDSVNSPGRRYVIPRMNLVNMWRHYLGGVAACAYAAPSRVTNCENLPAAYVEACELDPLRDEAIELGCRLLRARVSVDLHVVAGAPHGFDMVAAATVTRQAFANRCAALRKAFGTRTDC